MTNAITTPPNDHKMVQKCPKWQTMVLNIICLLFSILFRFLPTPSFINRVFNPQLNSQSRADMTSKRGQNDSNNRKQRQHQNYPKRYQNHPKWPNKWPKMVQNHPKMTPCWPQNGPKVPEMTHKKTQSGYKKGRKWFRKQVDMINSLKTLETALPYQCAHTVHTQIDFCKVSI